MNPCKCKRSRPNEEILVSSVGFFTERWTQTGREQIGKIGFRVMMTPLQKENFMKKAVRFIAVVLLLTTMLSACRTEAPEPVELDYARYQTTQEEVQAQIEKYGKVYYEAESSDSFAKDRVIISVYPFALDYEYTVEDFSGIDCTEVRQLSYYPDDRDMPTKFLILYISDRSRKGVLEAIEALILREDVYSAQPDFVIRAV